MAPLSKKIKDFILSPSPQDNTPSLRKNSNVTTMHDSALGDSRISDYQVKTKIGVYKKKISFFPFFFFANIL
jgi:hypothetical protein